MTELPTGTVTFLFTDIEGSTKFLQERGDEYAVALAEHRRVLREAFTGHGGTEVDTQGDAFFIAFARAADAVAAAETAQRELELPVRMGIHTGEPTLTAEGYVGIDVHRAARICAAAHGGQIVLSQTTRDLVEIPLRDLGEHRLKDLGQPLRLYQLGDADFPPLRSLNQTNLPAQPGELVGRERELQELVPLVSDSRLATLTGPGGSGKTRLALQTAAELVERFEGGVFWVPLAAVSDSELVEPTIAQTVGAQNGLAEHVADSELLLLLDNLEQVLEAAPRLSELLERCPNLHLLATSRALLRIAGEREYPVDPLPEADAVTLFCERAVVAEPLAAVHEICRRLDGLPLAIELAAARTRLLPPERLLERLGHALPVLTGGRRDAPERQRTLRATIEWSYDLLTGEEQRLFRRLAVFAGSFTLEAAEQVCGADLETLESLLEQSLVQTQGARLRMLETVREYASEQLEASDEADTLRDRHADYYAVLGEWAEPELEGPARRRWLEQLTPEGENARAAFAWALQRKPDVAARLATVARAFRISPRERLRWSNEALAGDHALEPHVIAKALAAGGWSAIWVDDFGAAATFFEGAIRLSRESGETAVLGQSLVGLGRVKEESGSPAEARALYEQAVERFERTDDARSLRAALGILGGLETECGNYGAARELLERSLDLAEAEEALSDVASTLHSLGDLALAEADPSRATELYQRSLELIQPSPRGAITAHCLAGTAAAAARQGNREAAHTLWQVAVDLEEQLGFRIAKSCRSRYEADLGAASVHTEPQGATLGVAEAVELALSLD